jgi:hypothetical protein
MNPSRPVAYTAWMTANEAAENPQPDPVAFELRCLWDSLATARAEAANGVWSVDCEHLVLRIAFLTMHTKTPTPPGYVMASLITDGIYQAIHEAIGIPVEISTKLTAPETTP